MENHPKTGYPCQYLGDGVYAEHDGYSVWLRVNDVNREPAVALEPAVMEALIKFHTAMRRKDFALNMALIHCMSPSPETLLWINHYLRKI